MTATHSQEHGAYGSGAHLAYVSHKKELHLPEAVENCLEGYFKNLNGVTPADDMYGRVIQQVEKPLIEHTLRYVKGNQVRAANILGINRNTLRKKIQALNIEVRSLGRS